LIPFETFQFSNGFISVIDKHSLNISEKSFTLDTSQSLRGDISDNFIHLLNKY
jgi:hypothetical protein